MKKLHFPIILHILFFILLGGVIAGWLFCQTPDYPLVKQGVLDLSNWNHESDQPITLTGDWEFSWKQYLSLKDYQKGPLKDTFFVPVPQVWNRYRINGEKLPGSGYATYHIKVILPKPGDELGIRTNTISTAYQLYINDRLAVQDGIVSSSPDIASPHISPTTFFFKPMDKEFDLTIHVSNYNYARGGLWSDIDFGTAKQIRAHDTFLIYKDGIIIGILSMMAVYFFCGAYILRQRRSYISFMLMCLLLIIRTSLSGDYLLIRLFPGISFHLLIWLSYQPIIWFPSVLYLMVESYFKQKPRNLLTQLFYFYAAAASVITAAVPASVFTGWLYFIEMIALGIFSSGLVFIFRAHLKRIPNAGILLTGSVIVGIAGLHDILYQANLIRAPFGEITPIGLVILMLFLFLLMADNLANTYREIQSLSHELASKLKLEKDLTERLYRLDRMKDEFMINTSHELRLPLNGIINITQSVLQGIGGQINQVNRQNLEVILGSARKLHILINDLLDVSLLHSGGVRISRKPLDLGILVCNMLAVFQHLKKSEAIDLLSEIPVDFPLVFADEVRLRQIFGNIVGNALKFTVSGSITIRASHDGECAQICVADTGIGMAPEKIKNIFNAFEQVDGTIQRKYESDGLGLYIARHLIELHGGRIWITSDSGKGSQVSFTIPLSTDQEIGTPPSVFTNTGLESVMDFLETDPGGSESRFEILAVDDDPSNLRALTNILRLANYNVRSVTSGKEALTLLESGITCELVILDVMMPELSGLEVLEVLRKKYTRLELPVLMLTSRAQHEDMSLCFKLGANDYLAKPFEAEELLARVNSLASLKSTTHKLVNSEMSFLQAQIKPHFIHNALSVISSLSIKDPPKAKSLILDLSDYLRGSFDLNHEEGLTTLSKELDLVRAYLSIEQARFKERLQIYYHLYEGIDCSLPLLTIQPLVENAIRHGILRRLEGGTVHLTTTVEAGRIRIEIRDNGLGMQPEQIEQFYEQKQDRAGVGMSNIHRRLLYYYGEGLHIESQPYEGTTIFFYIPYQTEQET
jgi:signal transduction histidine kinase